MIWNNMTFMWRHCCMVACRNIVTLANPFISAHFCYIWWPTAHIFCYLFISCIKIWPMFLWRRWTLVHTHPVHTPIICLNRPCMRDFTLIFMMTSSNGNIFRVTGPLFGDRWIPHTKAVTRSFDVFFYLRLNKRLSKQPWGWLSETPS